MKCYLITDSNGISWYVCARNPAKAIVISLIETDALLPFSIHGSQVLFYNEDLTIDSTVEWKVEEV